MRILYISDSAIPSSSPNSIHVMKMCQAFAKLGHQVTLLAKNTTACRRDIENVHSFYAVESNFNIKIFPFVSFKGSGAIYNLHLILRPMLTSAELVYTRSITAAFFLLLYNRPVVFEVHEPFEGKGFRLRKMFKFIIGHKKLRKLVVISSALKQYYRSNFNVKSLDILVAHDGADEFPSFVRPYNFNGFSVGYVGSLYQGKGMEILLPLAQKCTEIQFHIVGGSAQQINHLKNRYGELSNVAFHGFKSQQELPSFIASFNVLIAPYTDVVKVSEKKGANNLALWMSPLKLFEYMSAQKPIIVSDLSVIREILKHNETALLCKPDSEDLSEWIAAIYSLKNNPQLGERLAINAHREFEQNYTWDKRAAMILQNLDVL